MKQVNLRFENQRLILQYIREHGSGSKAGIAEACGLSKPTAGKIIDQLLAADVLEPVSSEPDSISPGRPSQHLQLHTGQARFALLEIGVCTIHCRLVSVAGQQQDQYSFTTPPDLTQFVAQFTEWWQTAESQNLWSVAISLSGVVDETEDVVLKSPNVSWTEGRACITAIKQITQLPCFPVQEIRALALAHFYEADSVDSFLYVHSDDGLGAAVVIDGQLFHGASALSAEIGHTPIPGHQRLCGCGNRGCLETLVAVPGLLKDLNAATWEEARQLMSVDNPVIIESIAHFSQHIASAINMSGVKNLVLGSRINEYPENIKTLLEKQIRAACLWSQFGEIGISYSHVSHSQGLVAAIFDRALCLTVDWGKPCQI